MFDYAAFLKKSDLVSRFEGVGKQFERQPSQNTFQSLMVFRGSCRARACRQLRLVIFKVCLHLMREATRLQSHNFPQLLKETDYLNYGYAEFCPNIVFSQ